MRPKVSEAFCASSQLIATRALCLSLTGLAAVCATAQPERRGPMNILLIMADDLRPELGCYGADNIQTPNIDRFAATATLFENAYCNIPVSGASRASLFTGLYPNYPSRFTNFSARASVDCPGAVTVFGWLKEHGYHTVSNGKVMHHLDDHADDWSEAPWRLHPDGYDVYWAQYNKWELWLNTESGRHINPKTLRGPFYERADVPDTAYDDGHVMLKTIADLRRLRDSGQPFFLACGFWKPHLPFCAPRKYWDLYDEDTLPMASNQFRPAGLPPEVRNSTEINAYALVGTPQDTAFLRKVKHGYYACVSYVDVLFGQVMDALERLGLSQNTIVILTSDHGWDLGEHQFVGKHNLMDCTTRIPLIVRVPGQQPARTRSMVELVDLFPTLCELCGIEQPKGLDGQSFRAVLKDPSASTKQEVYIQWEGGDDLVNPAYNYAHWSRTDHTMLFDHRTDPSENENVAQQPRYQKVAGKLSKRLKSRKKRAYRTPSSPTKHQGSNSD